MTDDVPEPPADRPAWAPELAEWWRRAAAVLVDGVVVGVPLGLLLVSLGLIDFDADADTIFPTAGTAATLIQLVVVVGYSAILEGSARGQSLGKMALRIRVADATTGDPVGPSRAALRRLVYMLLFSLFAIPGIVNALSPLWDKRRQAWHDKAVGSVVVVVPPVGSGHG